MTTPNIIEVPIAEVHLNPFQMWAIEPAHVAELAASIQADGLIQIPLARPRAKGGYELAVGHHRRAALAQLGKATMPIEVRPLADHEMARAAVAENYNRRTLTALDKARAIERLMQSGLTQADAGAQLGLTQSGAANLLRLLRLPAPVQDLVAQGEIPERLARQLVSMSTAAPKLVDEVSKAVAKATDKEAALNDSLTVGLERHGVALDELPFAMDWQPPAQVAEEYRRPCAGCEWRLLVRGGDGAHCMRPACAEAKSPARLQELLAETSKRTGVAVAAAGEKTTPVLGLVKHYERVGPAEALLRTKAAHLRLVESKGRTDHWMNRELTGHRLLALATVNPAEAKAWMEAYLAQKEGSAKTKAKASKAPAAKAETAAEKARREAAEAKEQQARRAERARQWRLQEDVRWLIETVTSWASLKIGVSEQVGRYLLDGGLHGGNYGAWSVAKQWKDDFEARVRDGGGGTAWLWLAREVGVCLPFSGPTRSEAWAALVRGIQALVEGGGRVYMRERVGLGVTLPKGWDVPPVHRTECNCWSCGRFTGNTTRRLSKAELAEGWVIEQKGEQLLRVTCPDCKPGMSADMPKAAKAKAKAKKGKAK